LSSELGNDAHGGQVTGEMNWNDAEPAILVLPFEMMQNIDSLMTES
jgi:hypothetical protein